MEEKQIIAIALDLLKQLADKQESNEHCRVLFCALYSALRIIDTENSILMFSFIQSLSKFIGETIDKENFTLQ